MMIIILFIISICASGIVFTIGWLTSRRINKTLDAQVDAIIAQMQNDANFRHSEHQPSESTVSNEPVSPDKAPITLALCGPGFTAGDCDLIIRYLSAVDRNQGGPGLHVKGSRQKLADPEGLQA